jgi:hypothetical protein
MSIRHVKILIGLEEFENSNKKMEGFKMKNTLKKWLRTTSKVIESKEVLKFVSNFGIMHTLGNFELNNGVLYYSNGRLETTRRIDTFNNLAKELLKSYMCKNEQQEYQVEELTRLYNSYVKD